MRVEVVYAVEVVARERKCQTVVRLENRDTLDYEVTTREEVVVGDRADDDVVKGEVRLQWKQHHHVD